MADLLELEGAVVYRVLAYRRAAKSLRETPESVARLSGEGRLRGLAGMGEKTEQSILAGLRDGAAPAAVRVSIGRLRPLAERIVDELCASRAVVRCDLAGSLRRYAETAKDVDIVAAVTDRI